MQCVPCGQTFPQVPQFLSSVFSDTHRPEQYSSVPVQSQLPPLQIAPPVQTVPQEPQLVWLVWRFTHTPLQLVSPCRHPHTPPVHC